MPSQGEVICDCTSPGHLTPSEQLPPSKLRWRADGDEEKLLSSSRWLAPKFIPLTSLFWKRWAFCSTSLLFLNETQPFVMLSTHENWTYFWKYFWERSMTYVYTRRSLNLFSWLSILFLFIISDLLYWDQKTGCVSKNQWSESRKLKNKLTQLSLNP